MFGLRVCHLALVLVNFIASGQCFDAKAFDDKILFKINWPGSNGADLLTTPPPHTELYTITSANKEQYQCLIPNISDQELATDKEYTGKNPIELLAPLFEPSGCSYRLESYWTYEVCHGRYVFQYHEERDGKREKQKYELGKLETIQLKALLNKYDELAKNPNRKSEIPYKKIDGVNMPYVEIEMTDGTICDLNEKPRSIKIFYVCHHKDKHEVYSIKEVASCEYEAVVKTPWLCDHPDYRLEDTEENKIICKPMNNAPRKPRSLMVLETERMKMRYQKVSDSKLQKVYAILRINKDGQDGQSQISVVIHPDDGNRVFSLDNPINYIDHGSNILKSNTMADFLSGKNCLLGGSGWWKFEFCYGRSVIQYHIEADGSKTVINLGQFDQNKHIAWIQANPDKKPKPIDERKYVSHLYSQGSMCDAIQQPRQTEVKLKCAKNKIGSAFSVSMFLEEHKTCEYELTVEAQSICDLLNHADSYGIIDRDVINNVDKSISSLSTKNDEERIARDGDEL